MAEFEEYVVVESFFDEKNGRLVIRVNGRFDYSCHKMFKNAFMEPALATTYEVDLSEVTYLDSSALGMLLLLRDHAGGDVSDVLLTHCNQAVMDILRIANFHRLFKMSE